MYCSSCGGALTEGWCYCNRCGANLSISKAGGATPLPESLGGLGPRSGNHRFVRHHARFDAGDERDWVASGVMLLFVGLIFLTMVAVDSVLAWQLFRLSGRASEPRVVAPVVKLDTNDFGLKREQPVLEPRASVTENTTRNFEPVYEERGNRE